MISAAWPRRTLLVALCFTLLACAGRRRERAVAATAETIRSRTGFEVDASSDVFASKPSQDVRALLQKPLNADDAVRLAVINNKRVRAELDGLGIAVSAVVAAARPPNPRVEGHAGFDNGLSAYGGTVEIALSRLLTLGKASGLAKHQLAAERLRVGNEVMGFALHARSSFHSYLAARKLVQIGMTMLEAAEASKEAARALLEAGNIRQLDYEMEHAFAEESRLTLAMAQKTELNLREDLNTFFGVWGPYTRWVAVDDFPALPAQDPVEGDVERAAIEQSLMLAQMRQQIEAQAAQVGLAKVAGIVPEINAGVDVDFEEEFSRVGPVVSAEIPLFDQGQSETMRARAMLDQTRSLYVATAVEVRSLARRARNNLTITRQVVLQYQDAIIPLRKRVIREQLKQYNAMEAGVFEVLQSKRQELEATQNHVRALRDYWVARAELAQLLAGGSLSRADGGWSSTSGGSQETGGSSSAQQGGDDD